MNELALINKVPHKKVRAKLQALVIFQEYYFTFVQDQVFASQTPNISLQILQISSEFEKQMKS